MTVRHRILAVLAVASLGAACNGTSTGNPVVPGLGAPEGIKSVRSSLSRDENPSIDGADLATFQSDSRDFALNLYGELAGAQGGNLFVSPYSIRVALAMTYVGARGTTRTEMADALRFTLNDDVLHRGFNRTALELDGRPEDLIEADDVSGDLLLRVVNGVFAQRGSNFESEFLDTLATQYGAGIFEADFDADAERERLAINQWVEENTEDRIVDLLAPGSVTFETEMVLANTIYFKGSWLTPFNASMTAPEVFHAPGGDVTVDTMKGFAESYAEGDGYKALSMPYIAPDVSMLVMMPDEGRFDEFEQSLDRTRFDAIRGELSTYAVDVQFPKFSFSSSFQLKQALIALGMPSAFLDADLTGISSSGGLVVEDVIHQAFVAVDEEGTEAAAATAVLISAVSAPPPAEFHADRPFLFFIYDEPTGQILFTGRVTDPS